ncbi:hypothetical protein SOVF_003860, partial [Spinacia oleracea]
MFNLLVVFTNLPLLRTLQIFLELQCWKGYGLRSITFLCFLM